MNHAESAYGLWFMVYGRWLSLTQQFLSCSLSVFLDLPLRAIGVHLGPFRLLSLLYLSKCMVFL